MRHATLCTLSLLAACDPAPRSDVDLRVLLAATPRASGAPSAAAGELDAKITALQAEVRQGRAVVANLEKLGRAFVSKARQSHDPGFYKLAEQCALAAQAREPGHAGARLLQGHVLHSLHQFAAAEQVARALVEQRGDFADHGLLGDVRYDQGDVRGALEHYQRMLDLKPCLQSYVRTAQVRWIRGDLASARQLLRLAIGAGSQRDPEALSWAYARLASIELQDGAPAAARTALGRGLELLPDAVSLLGVDARLRAAEGERDAALRCAARAAELCPLPEYRWLHADLLAEVGDAGRQASVERDLAATGELDDPRHYALFLLSRGRDLGTALRLAEQELRERQDVFSHDLHAFALLHAGRLDAAQAAIDRALALETRDPRLHYHAMAIAAARGDRARARTHLDIAQRGLAALWPSERRDLAARAAHLSS